MMFLARGNVGATVAKSFVLAPGLGGHGGGTAGISSAEQPHRQEKRVRMPQTLGVYRFAAAAA